MRLDNITVIRDDGLGDGNPRFRLSALGPWFIAYNGLDGFDGLDVDISTQNYAQYDGGRVTGERVAAVDRTVSGIGIGDPSEMRRQAERFFRFGTDFEVHVESGDRRRFCRARQMGLRLATDNATGHQLIEWTFLATDPYWLDEDERGFDIAEASRKRGFPFVSWMHRVAPEPEADEVEDGPGPAELAESPVEKHVRGFVAGVISHRIRMTNDGGATAYPRFVITATDAVENPRVAIYDESGASVCSFGVAVTLGAGDELVIDFSARPTSITLNGENVSYRATQGSTLATGIDPGDFVLEWNADSGDAAMSVRPYVRDRFVTI